MSPLISPLAWWGLAAAVPAVGLEVLYRYMLAHNIPYLSYIWIMVPSSLLISYSIYRLVTYPATSLLDAFIVWAFSTTFLRVIATLALGDVVKGGTWFALALLIMARVAQAFWGR